jgi:RNA-directed DNA polymerase
VNHYRHAAAKRTFGYLDYDVSWRVGRWLRKKHPRMTWKQINRRYLNDDHSYQDGGLTLYKPAHPVTHYRYRGARIPTPWTTADLTGPPAEAASLQEQLPLERVKQALA